MPSRPRLRVVEAEIADAQRQIDAGLRLDRKRLQRKRVVRAADKGVGAHADARRYGAARASVVAGERAAAGPRVGEDAPDEAPGAGDADIKAEAPHRADVMLDAAITP